MTTSTTMHVILFYKYHALPNPQEHCRALQILCHQLSISQGRLLVATEGINGTLAATNKEQLDLFCQALGNRRRQDEEQNVVLQEFWKATCQTCPLVLEADDFKWSHTSTDNTTTNDKIFPDLKIVVVPELIASGGVLTSIPLDQTGQGYLTPQEWHRHLLSSNNKIVIDCRNTKEYQIGHFDHALNPQTTTFTEFPQWVEKHKDQWTAESDAQGQQEPPTIYMYCTGGIRCEKASAYIRQAAPHVQNVYHLKGGIHKYLEEYGNNDSQESLWKGKNFVFDGRGALGTDNDNDVVVGRCAYCQCPHDVFEGNVVCTVCREPVLVCPSCRRNEYHCDRHFEWKDCYFSNLSAFSFQDLDQQHQELQRHLQAIAVGKAFKAKRKTLTKQINKVRQAMATIMQDNNSDNNHHTQSQSTCRNCGQINCPQQGKCWGFYGLHRKKKAKPMNDDASSSASTIVGEDIHTTRTAKNNNAHLQDQKQQEQAYKLAEWKHLDLCQPAWSFRHEASGIRLPPPCTRILQARVKGSWCGKSVQHVLKTQFSGSTGLDNVSVMKEMIDYGLILVNGVPISSLEEATSRLLRNMDTIGRIVHWHEAPVQVPHQISVSKYPIFKDSKSSRDPLREVPEKDLFLWAISKPATVPVHPAGPYLANCLTSMVEGQEGLSPQSLIPCHRIDRVTSGLTICCTHPQVSKWMQSRMILKERGCRKYYLALVSGLFPRQAAESSSFAASELMQIEWKSGNTPQGSRAYVWTSAPVETVDPANGIRQITAQGKPSQSLFVCLARNEERKESLVLCRPLTGRSHQLRLHLQALGYPIVGDLQYGSAKKSMDGSNTFETAQELIRRQCLSSSTHDELTSASLSKEQAANARKACPVCRKACSSKESLSDCFSVSQLLVPGRESIALHAWRYYIPLDTTSPEESRPVKYMHLQVDDGDVLSGLPPFAVPFLDTMVEKTRLALLDQAEQVLASFDCPQHD